ncbi:prion-inhibition and propagation-domain-containing protein [Hypoxylon cercidicola]|nr:prion-inhibition and propagation-domain-containing protein [Hypoxylon cercidicola]
MDPVGVSFGAVSLLFQVFSGCIKAYQLASEARGLEEKHRFLRVRFKTEQYRLLDWGAVAKIDEEDGVFLTSKGNRAVVMEVLDQQHRLMMSCQRLDERVRTASILFCEVTDAQCETRSEAGGNSSEELDDLTQRFPNTDGLLSKALDLVDRTRKLPARLRWVVSDRDKMEDLLSRLAALNDFLRDMLSTHQLEMLRAQEVRTSYQIVQMNSRMDHLIEVIQAGILPLPAATTRRPAPAGLAASPTPNQAHTDEFGQCLRDLVKLAQFKAVSHAVEGQALDNDLRDQIGLQKPQDGGPRGLSLDPSLLDLDFGDLASSSDQRRATGWYCDSSASKTYRRIWIEWKEMEHQHSHNSCDGPNPVTLQRFQALVALLREDEVISQFRAPKCLGYFFQKATRAALRYGLVFENPSEVPPSHCPTSLRSLLRGDFRTPSLSARVALIRTLAECLERLHAVNWLHKGIRSENILFFSRDGNDTLDLNKPYLSGFDYSRPEDSVSMSENPPTNLSDDLYRHPNVQGGPVERGRSSGYRKFHDIYSMGVVFVEISLWKPLEAVVGVSDVARLKVSDILSVRDTLMSKSYQESIESRMGDTVAEVIQACLNGMPAFDLTENAQGEDSLDGEQLQARFYEIVVKPLTGLKI